MSRNPAWVEGWLSHSRMKELRRCTRAHHIKYDLKLEPKTPPSLPMQIGDYVHKVLEFVGGALICGDANTAELWQCGAVFASGEHSVDPLDPKAVAEGARLVTAYRQRYGDERAGWGNYELVSVEEVLPASTLHDSVGGYGAIADVVLKDEHGRRIIAERKTAGTRPRKSEQEILRGLRTWSQLRSLAYCGRDQWGETPGIIYDLITKTKQVDFYRSPVIWFTDEELAEWEETERGLEQLLPLNIPNFDQCDLPWGKCEYTDWCFDPLGREILYQVRKKR